MGLAAAILGFAPRLGAHVGDAGAGRLHLCVNPKGKARFVPATPTAACRPRETAMHVAAVPGAADLSGEGAAADAVLAATGDGAVAWKTFAQAGANAVDVAAESGLLAEPDVHNLGSIAVTAPADGLLLVVFQLPLIFFGDATTVRFGLGSTNAVFDYAESTIGRLDGANTDRYREVGVVTALVPVTAGQHTVYANAQRTLAFHTNEVNTSAGRLVALFVPGSL